ncbi:hypothetical protein KW841_15915 [Pseudomonas sp. PDM28]|uniref:hypothetical protein n=1 Tax=Pseudomonas sp. PDM28 TaxID=2854770 RepID=UPI001C45346E|nr:hypothetical protein [Pseudomonas sp. PDM28]MBV7553836.1 hypothetical protein [Pseudomonas sp. PDM28]
MTNQSDKSLQPLSLAPDITTPNNSSTVSRGFWIKAWAGAPAVIDKWNVFIYIGGREHRFEPKAFNPGFVSYMEFRVPTDLIPPGPFWFKIEYRYRPALIPVYSPWAYSGDMTMADPRPPKPVITNPGTVWVPRPEIQGRGGVQGATVELYEEGVGTVRFGTASVQSNGSWKAVLTQPLWMADPFKLTAMQKLNDRESAWATPVLFAVLFRPVIRDVTVSADGKPTIKGNGGLKDATLQIYKKGDEGSVLLSTTVQSDGSWSVSAPTAWLAGSYSITAKQIGKVTKQTSDWAVVTEFTVNPPVPGISSPQGGSSHPAGSLTVSGSCLAGATVEILNDDNSRLADAAVNGTAWSYTRSWDTGRKVVKARQKVRGATSVPSAEREFFILSGVPGISLPEPGSSHPPGSLTVSGSCLAGAKVEILNEDDSRLADATVNGTAWSYIRSWDTGRKVVKARQTVNGVPSLPSGAREFFINSGKPGISLPLQGSLHPEGRLTVSGSCLASAKVEVLNEDNSKLADAIVAGTDWSYTRSWDVGRKVVKARQTVNGLTSDPSDTREFFIKPSKPAITQPTQPVALRQELTITGVYPNDATLEMFRDVGTKINGTFSTTGGTRTFIPAQDWVLGTNTVKVVQTVKEVVSDPSDMRTFTLKPPKPSITQPPHPAAPRQVLTITAIHSGSVTLKMLDGENRPVTGTFRPSGTTGTFTPAQDWAPGANRVKAVQIVGGVESDASELCIFSTQPLKLTILPPPEIGAPRQSLTMVGIHGNATGFKMLDQASSEIPGHFTRSGDTCTFTPDRNWTPGNNTVKAVQIVNDVESDPSDPCTFKARPNVPAINPPAGPADPMQELSISEVHADAALMMFEHPSTPVHGSYAGTGATRVFTPRDPWAAGDHLVMVEQTVNGTASELSEGCAFTVSKLTAPVVTFPEQDQFVDHHFSFTGTNGYAGPGSIVAVYGANDDKELVEYAIPNVDGTWVTGPVPIAPMTFELRVRAEAGGVHSDFVYRKFTIRPTKPEVLPPIPPVGPKQSLEIVQVFPRSTLRMFDGEGIEIPGRFSIQANTQRMMFTPDREWSLGVNTVSATATYNGVDSSPGDPCTFMVEAVNPPPPIITFPQLDQIIDLNSSFTGTDGYPAPDAVVSICEPETGHEWARALPDIDGTWTTSALPQGPGFHEIHGFVSSGELSSDPVPLSFKIRPPKPAITPLLSPVERHQPLTITGVYSASATLVLIDGSGNPVPGIFDGSGAERVFTPDQAWPVGENKVTVTQTEEEVISAPSDECVFIVVEQEKPNAPQFELPPEGTRTPTRPVIQVRGLPDALITVRLKNGEVLRSASADAEGVLAFTTDKPLHPGTIELEVKQQGSGQESPWSEPHSFIVKTAPQKPGIDAPTEDSRNSRKFVIRGKGETRGKIHIHHANDLENPIVRIDGLASWRWQVTSPWDVGSYHIRVRQVDETDSSDWSDPRAFEVVDARLLIAGAGPVLAQPVVGNNESVLLRVQVVTSQTWEGAEGIAVEWSDQEDAGVRATTLTDSEGWAHYRYTPDTPGEHRVQADVTGENEGVMTLQLFEVTALEENSWERPFGLYLNGKKIDPARDQLVLVHGTSYELKLGVNDASQMGSIVTLEDLTDAVQQGMEFDPPLGTPQTITAGIARWSIVCGSGGNGLFGLKLTSSRLPDWHLPGRLLANDLAEDVYMSFDTYRTIFGRAAYPCHGMKHLLAMRALPGSHLIGKEVTLQWVGDTAADLGIIVTPDPAIPQLIDETNFVRWEFDCVNSIKDGSFAVQLNVDELNFKSMPLMMSLAHNAIKVSETFGPQEVGGYYRYGVRAVSIFTGHPAGKSPVLVTVTGQEPTVKFTEENGWIHIDYDEGESATLTLISPFLDMGQQPWPGP